MNYKPVMSNDEIEIRRKWHDAGFIPKSKRKGATINVLGLKLYVPKEVYAPQPTAPQHLGRAVLKEVRDTDRVLDVGTGSGVNAILAASRSSQVMAIDINPFAIRCARKNAKLNGVDSRIIFKKSNVFKNVNGRFDLIIFNPPFRWFAPRDILEASVADKNFRAMTAFFKNAKSHLTQKGRILLFYGDTGDMRYLKFLIKKYALKVRVLYRFSLDRYSRRWNYYTFRLTR